MELTPRGEATLTLEDELALGRRAQDGDESAIQTLVESNLRFAMYLANRYRRDGVDVDDLMQEASIGLLQAARRYDPDHGVRFASYAGWWVEAQLRRYLDRHGSAVRVTGSTRQLQHRLKQAEEHLLQVHGHASLEMIAAEAGIDLDTAERVLSRPSGIALSLDRHLGDGEDDFSLQDIVADDSTDEAFGHAEVMTILGPLLQQLGTRERQILLMRYAEQQTCAEVGLELNISASRVQQLEIQAIRRLRKHMLMGNSAWHQRRAAA